MPPSETILPNIPLNNVANIWLTSKLEAIEQHTKTDVLAIYGGIVHGLDIRVRIALESLEDRKNTLLVILHTQGGVVEETNNIVQVLREHYDDVHFLVPVYAMSAGTVLTLSGDKIYMDYFSKLGPIDPQIVTDTNSPPVPVLSYLRQYEKLIAQSKAGALSSAEFALLNKLDLAQLHSYELAANLSVSLIKDWLPRYKFKDWDVPAAKKEERAEEIADKLNNHERWYTHGSSIHKKVLEKELQLIIDDYSEDVVFKRLVWDYFSPLMEYTNNMQIPSLIHSRTYL